MDMEQMLARLAQRLERAPLSDLVRLSGGASQETWRFHLSDGAYVLRRALGGGIANDARLGGGKLTASDEAQVIMATHAAGACVPEVIHICDEVDGLGHAFVMRFIEGETIARKILRDDKFANIRPNLAAQCGTVLAQIHAIAPPAALPVSDAQGELAHYEAVLRKHDFPHPVFELALQWLKAHMPPPCTQHKLIHGDFRNGNFIIDADKGLVAVLDWELAHCGDPMEDLGWIAVPSWRFGQHQNPIGGFGAREDFYAAYEAAGGVLRHETIRFWEVLGTLKWGIMCTMMVTTFQSGQDRSPERAAIGRRASETEIDLLFNILED